MADIELLSVVALLRDQRSLHSKDMPARNLKRGQVGTVVKILAPGVFEVEFSDDSGQSYAFATLRADQLIRLHHEPSQAA